MKINPSALNIFFVHIVLLFLSTKGFAADGKPTVSPPKGPLITVDANANKVLTFTTWDGNQMGLYTEHGPAIPSFLGLQEVENTCEASLSLPAPNAVVMSQCQIHFWFYQYTYSIRWIQHKDPTKIGNIVQFGSRPDSDHPFTYSPLLASPPDQSLITVSSYLLNQDPGTLQKPPLDTLTCDNWDWLAQAPHATDGSQDLVLQSVVSEEMRLTTETSYNENQGSASSFDVHLHSVDASSYAISVHGPSYPSLMDRFGFAPYLASQTLVINFKSEKTGGICQVTFSASTAQFQNDRVQPGPMKPDPSTRELSHGLIAPISAQFSLISQIGRWTGSYFEQVPEVFQ